MILADPDRILADDNEPDGLTFAELLARPAWQSDGACREHPEITWFPERGQPSAPAKRVCAGCLVRSECAEWALAQDRTLAGIWGGLSHQQRRRATTVRPAKRSQPATRGKRRARVQHNDPCRGDLSVSP